MIDRFLLVAAPAARLAVFRILVGAFAAGYLLVRLPVLLELGDEPRARWQPVGVLWWASGPAPGWLMRTAVLATIALAVLVAAGIGFRVSGPVFALALLLITTYRSSGGRLLWFDNLLVLHAAVLAFSPAADALRLPFRLPFGRAGRHHSPAPDGVRYGWPLRVAAVVTVVTYVLAGLAKLRIGGAGWVDGESLRNHIAYSATRLRVLGGTPSPVAGPLMERTWVFAPLAVATLVIELGAPVVLFVERLRWPWAITAWLMHAAIAATMFVVFPYPLAFLAFAPLFRLERLVPTTRVRRPRRRP